MDKVQKELFSGCDLDAIFIGGGWRFRLDFKVAFGGFKESGIGRECGTEGLRAYLEPKTIILTDIPRHHRA